MKHLAVVMAVLVGLVAPAAPAWAEDPPFEVPPDNTTLPILDEVTASGPLAKQYRISVPEGGSLELAAVLASQDSNAVHYIQTDWEAADGSDYFRQAISADFESNHVFVTHEGDQALRHEVINEPAPGVVAGIAAWRVAESLPAGTYVITIFTASPGPVLWSRVRLRASTGVSIINASSGTETFYASCRDFETETEASVYAAPFGATATMDATHVISVTNGLVGTQFLYGATYQDGYVLNIYSRIGTGEGGYLSPDGTDHVGLHHFWRSPATGDYTVYVDHVVARTPDCGFVAGADLAPA